MSCFKYQIAIFCLQQVVLADVYSAFAHTMGSKMVSLRGGGH